MTLTTAQLRATDMESKGLEVQCFARACVCVRVRGRRIQHRTKNIGQAEDGVLKEKHMGPDKQFIWKVETYTTSRE